MLELEIAGSARERLAANLNLVFSGQRFSLREGSISVLWQPKVSRIAGNPNPRVLILLGG